MIEKTLKRSSRTTPLLLIFPLVLLLSFAVLPCGDEDNSKVWAVGVDSDQYGTSNESVREYILTSMLKRVDTAVYNIIKAQRDGEFSGGTVNHDLANDGVGYATSGGFADDIRELIEGPKAFIVRDLFDVPTVPFKDCREPQTYNLRY